MPPAQVRVKVMDADDASLVMMDARKVRRLAAARLAAAGLWQRPGCGKGGLPSHGSS
jgi:hypothetical protein